MPVRLKTTAIHRPGVSLHHGAAIARLGGQDSGRGPLLVASERVQARKVALGDLGDVLAAEDADLKVHVGPWGQFGAARLQVVEVLVDDCLGANVFGDFEAVALVGDEFAWRGEVDTARKKVLRGGDISDVGRVK